MVKDQIKYGLIATILIAILGYYLNSFVPLVGATSLSLILGIIIGNLFLQDKKYIAGVKFSEKKILSTAIMLLGVTLQLSTVFSLGIKGIIFIILIMAFTILINLYIGKLLGFSQNFSLLMGAGNAVCGSSAIVASSSVLDAKEDEIGIPIAIVNLIGTIFMFVLPFLAIKVLKLNDFQSGALIGGALQSVGQVVASGNSLGEDVEKIAILFKMIRVSFLGVIIIIFSIIQSNSTLTKKDHKIKFHIPKFIIVFFILSFLVSLGVINNYTQHILKNLSHYLLLIGMAAIGMRVRFKELLNEGFKGVLFGFLSMAIQLTFIISLVKLIF